MSLRRPLVLLVLLMLPSPSLCLVLTPAASPFADVDLSALFPRPSDDATRPNDGWRPLFQALTGEANAAEASALGQWFQQPTRHPRPDDALMADYPYLRFLPAYGGQLVPGAAPVRWSNWCFASNIATVHNFTAQHLTLEVTVGEARSALCSDSYALLSCSHLRLQTFTAIGTHIIHLPAPSDPALRHDLVVHGIRLGRFAISPPNILQSLKETALLFTPFFTPFMSLDAVRRNRDFLLKYAQREMAPLSTQPIPPDESEVKSGDLFGGFRFDGMDPVLMWATASSAAHFAVAVRVNGSLYVSESIAKVSYWPTGGIQLTPWARWVAQIKQAGYQFVWLPLREDLRSIFNASGAQEALKKFLGLPYGFQNIAFCWLDTEADNYPCLPPRYDVCLDWRVVMPFLGVLDHASGGQVGRSVWTEALNKRLGRMGLTTAEAFQEAWRRNLSFAQLMALPERDEWRYSTGGSRMCVSWACELLKSAGLFGQLAASIQCTEMTGWDLAALPFFSKQQQIAGQHEMTVVELGGKPWAPYAQYAEACGGHPPLYHRAPRC
eukprot:EG_transcript_8177